MSSYRKQLEMPVADFHGLVPSVIDGDFNSGFQIPAPEAFRQVQRIRVGVTAVIKPAPSLKPVVSTTNVSPSHFPTE
jgi:hypothetical protein